MYIATTYLTCLEFLGYDVLLAAYHHESLVMKLTGILEHQESDSRAKT